jgi:hypothetical protein
MIHRVLLRGLLAILLIGLPAASWCAAAGEGAKKLPSDKLADNARMVLHAVVKAATDNQRLPRRKDASPGADFRKVGDDLTVYYIRAAAAVARRLPEDQAATAFLLAVGIALDDSTMLRDNLLTRGLWRRVEPDEARKQRLRVLGEPTLYGRHDLAQHFAVSAALTAVSGAEAAQSAGILKEILDSRGGSGFSFADLSADFAGIAFARRMLDKPSRLADIEKAFRIADYAISPRGLPEGLTAEQFAKQYGSIKDERYLRLQADIRKRIAALPGYADTSKEK